MKTDFFVNFSPPPPRQKPLATEFSFSIAKSGFNYIPKDYWARHMWIFSLYRFYASLCAGAAVYFFLIRSVWISLLAGVIFRSIWLIAERFFERLTINRDFKRHLYSFKQQLGPYGIRIANKAEEDWGIKKSLAEVFVSDPARLKKNVDQLTMMDTLFQAGMRPDGDAYLLHDCKLKFGTFRLEREHKAAQ
jgi:hypothetical protein